MKTTKLAGSLTFLILVSIIHFGCPPPAPPVGEWIDSSLREAVIFHENGTFESLYFYNPDPTPQLGQPPPQIPDDKTWKVKFRGTYVIDSSKKPAWIDLVFSDQGTQRRLEGLINFLDNNTCYLAFGDARPASLDNASRKARFTRAATGEISPITK